MFTYGCLRGLKSAFKFIGMLRCTDWLIIGTTVPGPAYEHGVGGGLLSPACLTLLQEVDCGVDAQIC